MSERDWEKLAELLNKVVSGQGTWQEKKAELSAKMDQECADAALEEIIGWFQGDDVVTA